MEPTVGQQLLLNDRPGVVVSIAAGDQCQLVTCLWPGVLAPPRVQGVLHPGQMRHKFVTLLYMPEEGRWWWDIDHAMRVQENPDATRHIHVGYFCPSRQKGKKPLNGDCPLPVTGGPSTPDRHSERPTRQGQRWRATGQRQSSQRD